MLPCKTGNDRALAMRATGSSAQLLTRTSKTLNDTSNTPRLPRAYPPPRTLSTVARHNHVRTHAQSPEDDELRKTKNFCKVQSPASYKKQKARSEICLQQHIHRPYYIPHTKAVRWKVKRCCCASNSAHTTGPSQRQKHSYSTVKQWPLTFAYRLAAPRATGEKSWSKDYNKRNTTSQKRRRTGKKKNESSST